MNSKTLQEQRAKAMQQRKKQKEKMNAQFMDQIKDTPTKQPAPSSNITIEQLEKEKKLRKKQKKEVQSAQRKLMQEKQAVKELQQKIRRSDETIRQLKYENWRITEQVSEIEHLKEKIKQLEGLVTEEREKTAKLAHSLTQMEAEKERGQRAGRKMLELSNQVKQLKESNTSLRQKLKNYDLLSHEEYGHLKKEVTDLQAELQVYRNMEEKTVKNPMFLMKYMKQHLTNEDLPDLFRLLENFISTDNLQHFYRGRHNIFYLYMRRVNLLNHHVKRRQYLYKIKNRHNRHAHERLGYVTQTHDDWVFVDITENDSVQTYPVKENSSKQPLETDAPVKARIQNEKATITECYPVRVAEPIHKAETQEVKTKSPKKYAYFGQFKILIIGSRFLSEYKTRLEQHGCLVELHNPYEESYEVLKGKMSRSEITLVCERHVPHGIWDHVEKKQPYVTVLKKDSKDLISTNAYLTLQRCELV